MIEESVPEVIRTGRENDFTKRRNIYYKERLRNVINKAEERSRDVNKQSNRRTSTTNLTRHEIYDRIGIQRSVQNLQSLLSLKSFEYKKLAVKYDEQERLLEFLLKSFDYEIMEDEYMNGRVLRVLDAIDQSIDD